MEPRTTYLQLTSRTRELEVTPCDRGLPKESWGWMMHWLCWDDKGGEAAVLGAWHRVPESSRKKEKQQCRYKRERRGWMMHWQGRDNEGGEVGVSGAQGRLPEGTHRVNLELPRHEEGEEKEKGWQR